MASSERLASHPDIHDGCEFFESVRVNGVEPPARPDRIDIALLDMNHSWPNLGHDALVHIVLEAVEPFSRQLTEAGLRVRVLSYDIRRTTSLPSSVGRFPIYLGTGGPGHLDPRLNDGVGEWSQGVEETSAWEAPLFRLFDAIHAHPTATLLAVCHSFGLLCRWSGVAHAELRAVKSSGMPLNALSDQGRSHPYFRAFADELPDRTHFRVVDNRLFDLVVDDLSGATALAFEEVGSSALTMMEFARHPDGSPRILGVNHHPEIIDREHILTVLEEKRAHAMVTEEWYRERAATMKDLFCGEAEFESQRTSHYTLIEPLRRQVARVVAERCGAGARMA